MTRSTSCGSGFYWDGATGDSLSWTSYSERPFYDLRTRASHRSAQPIKRRHLLLEFLLIRLEFPPSIIAVSLRVSRRVFRRQSP